MVDKVWYYAENEHKHGPFSTNTILEMYEQGIISSATLLSKAEEEIWRTIAEFDEFKIKENESDEAPPIPKLSNGNRNKFQLDKNVTTSNFIMRHWRGENSLAFAWWINLVLLSFLLNIVVSLLNIQETTSVTLGLGVTLSAILIYVWQIVGIWRSANNYIFDSENKLPQKSGFWGRLAKLGVILGAIANAGAYYPVLSDYVSYFRVGESGIEQYYIQITAETDLTLNGYINSKSVDEIINVFETNESLSALVLNSPGGQIASAFKLADYVIDNNLYVGARGECASACVFLLAAAQVSLITPETNIVFHHPESSFNILSPEGREAFDDVIEEYYQRLESYGVPSTRFSEFKSAGLTRLTIGEAYELSLINIIWNPTTGEFLDPAQVCQTTNCYTTPVVLNGASNNANMVGIFELEVGTCFDDVANSSFIIGVNSIPCDEPHNNEVFAVFDLDVIVFPEEQELKQIALDQCLEFFEEYVGLDYLSSVIEIMPFTPTAEAWRFGERQVSCVAFDMNLEKLDQTVKGSGR